MNWRALREADLPALFALAARVHPGYPEDDDVLAERLALHPAGCFALDGPVGDGLAGYLLAHPWTLGTAPKLNRRLGRLPAAPDCLYLHDLALHPAARGQGAAGRLLDQVLGDRRWPAHALVAVGGSAPFWRRHGFVAVPADTEAYGAGAAYMVRRQAR